MFCQGESSRRIGLELSQALAIRHRITHPKTPEDLEVSDADFADVEKATTWFSDSFETLVEEFKTKMTSLSEKLDELRTTAKAKAPASPAE